MQGGGSETQPILGCVSGLPVIETFAARLKGPS